MILKYYGNIYLKKLLQNFIMVMKKFVNYLVNEFSELLQDHQRI